jgi:pimeloyl-ACP methyl ester carboxylesterase
MADYVMVPGAWLGGWAWDDVAEPMRRGGHRCFPVTLTGLGDRASEASRDVDLETHVDDIVQLIEREDLRDALLVGHSYGGFPVTGAADRIPERIAKVIYVDSGPAQDGAAYVDTMPSEVRETTDRLVDEEGDGWRLPMPSWEELEGTFGASAAGIDAETRRSVRDRSTPQPIGTYTRAISLKSPARTELPHVLVSCSFPLDQIRQMIESGHPWFAELGGPQWELLEMPSSHWPMFSSPGDLEAVLRRLADRTA